MRDSELLIHPAEFVRCDLASTIPYVERCDLAMSIEFAEHVPGARNDENVRFLTESADVVLFSAAVPGQAGKGHINTRPARYWRDAFGKGGFDRYDVIRPQILFEQSIPRWLKQNLFLYASENGKRRLSLPSHQFLPEGFELIDEDILNRPPNLRDLFISLPDALKRAVLFRLP